MISLSESIYRYSFIAAFRDDRFSSVTLDDLPNLNCYLSIIGKFEDFTDPNDFEIGKHGVWVEFQVDGSHHSATYIPNVPKDQGWDHGKLHS